MTKYRIRDGDQTIYRLRSNAHDGYEYRIVSANAENWEAGDVVDTPDGIGIVDDRITEGTVDGMEATPDEPVYAVVVEDEDVGVGFYRGDELREGELPETPGDPADLAGQSANAMRANQEGFFEWPESWEESDTPARIIAMDAWLSMGAQHSPPPAGDSCTGTMRGKVVDPDRFCADFKDRLYGTGKWRGGWV